MCNSTTKMESLSKIGTNSAWKEINQAEGGVLHACLQHDPLCFDILILNPFIIHALLQVLGRGQRRIAVPLLQPPLPGSAPHPYPLPLAKVLQAGGPAAKVSRLHQQCQRHVHCAATRAD